MKQQPTGSTFLKKHKNAQTVRQTEREKKKQQPMTDGEVISDVPFDGHSNGCPPRLTVSFLSFTGKSFDR